MPPQAPGSLSDDEYSNLVAFLLRSNEIPADSQQLDFDSTAVVFLGDSTQDTAQVPVRLPVPGRAGTVPTPGTRNSIPEIATIYRSERALTRSSSRFHSPYPAQAKVINIINVNLI